MSIATKSGISTTVLQALNRIGSTTPSAALREHSATRPGAVAPALDVSFSTGARAGASPSGQGLPDHAPSPAPSMDSRYVRFVEAVQALRMDLDPTTLPTGRIERMLESARDIFMLDDGIPGPVEPPAARPIPELPELPEPAATAEEPGPAGDDEPASPDPPEPDAEHDGADPPAAATTEERAPLGGASDTDAPDTGAPGTVASDTGAADTNDGKSNSPATGAERPPEPTPVAAGLTARPEAPSRPR